MGCFRDSGKYLFSVVSDLGCLLRTPQQRRHSPLNAQIQQAFRGRHQKESDLKDLFTWKLSGYRPFDVILDLRKEEDILVDLECGCVDSCGYYTTVLSKKPASIEKKETEDITSLSVSPAGEPEKTIYSRNFTSGKIRFPVCTALCLPTGNLGQ